MLDATKLSAVTPVKMETTRIFFIIYEPVKRLLDYGHLNNPNIYLASQFLTLQLTCFCRNEALLVSRAVICSHGHCELFRQSELPQSV
jgi:hypothetical protein